MHPEDAPDPPPAVPPDGPPAVPGCAVGPAVGYGAGGPVWSAVGPDGRPVLVTVLATPAPAQAEAWVQGLRSLVGERHPHLAGVVDVVDLPDGRWALLAEPVQGTSLAAAVASRGRLSPTGVRELAVAVGGALQLLHERGVVHGDVSPATVLLADDGVPVLAGLVGPVAGGQGTAGFRAPERQAGAPAAPPADVWALAQVLRWAAAEQTSVLTALEPALAPDPRVRPDAGSVVGLVAPSRPTSGTAEPRRSRRRDRQGHRHRRRHPRGGRRVERQRPRGLRRPRRTALTVFLASVLAGGVGAAATLHRTEPVPRTEALRGVVEELLAERDRALVAGDAARLARLTVPGSDVARADSRLVTGLERRGVDITHVETTLLELTVVRDTGDGAVVEAVVRQRAAERILDDGSTGARESVGPQPRRCLVMELTGPAPWRLSGVEECALSG